MALVSMAAARWTRRSQFFRLNAASARRFSLSAAYNKKALAEGFLPDSCQIECLKRLETLQTQLVSSKTSASPRGLYMYGGVGTGKTMMLDLFHQVISSDGISSDRQHFHEFLQSVHRRLHKLRQRVGAQRGLLQLCAEEYRQEYPVLAFDEAHVLNVGDALMLRTFFEAYFNAGGVMVATSNVAPDDLYASGINREVFLPFLDALKNRCDFYEVLTAEDYRGRAVKAGKFRGSFLVPRSGSSQSYGAASPEQFPVLCRTLSLPDTMDVYPPVSVDIDVGFGRTLRSNRAWSLNVEAGAQQGTVSASRSSGSKSVVHFGFDELCRTATGPSEWVGIAEFADAVIITDVPQFAVHDEDAARRFITFVDIIYDKQKFLVITAAAGPMEMFSLLVEKYGGDAASLAPVPTAPKGRQDDGVRKMKMPEHGVGSGRHGVVFQKPKNLHYDESGHYVTKADDGQVEDLPVARAVSTTRTGGRAEHGAGGVDRVMKGVVQEDSDWVEWSATGLKDASLFDLSPTTTHTEITDKLLPFRRCASRLLQMRSQEDRP